MNTHKIVNISQHDAFYADKWLIGALGNAENMEPQSGQNMSGRFVLDLDSLTPEGLRIFQENIESISLGDNILYFYAVQLEEIK